MKNVSMYLSFFFFRIMYQLTIDCQYFNENFQIESFFNIGMY